MLDFKLTFKFDWLMWSDIISVWSQRAHALEACSSRSLWEVVWDLQDAGSRKRSSDHYCHCPQKELLLVSTSKLGFVKTKCYQRKSLNPFPPKPTTNSCLLIDQMCSHHCVICHAISTWSFSSVKYMLVVCFLFLQYCKGYYQR